MSKKKVFLRIASAMNTMPKSERRVAAFIMDNGKKVTQMTLAELASAAGVSEPSVLRCCHRLNYDGYTDMRNDLIRDLAIEANENQAHPQLGLSPNTQIEDVPSRVIYRSISALEDTLKLFNKEQYSSAIEAIHNAPFIALFGVANSASIADDAMNKFLRLGKKCSVVSDTHIQLVTALNLKRGDVAIGISHSGKTKETIEAIALAKSTGATVITISNYTSSKLSRYADISFVTADLESDYSSETIVSRICQLSIIDMLYLGVLFSHYPQYQDHLNKLNEEAIKHKF